MRIALDVSLAAARLKVGIPNYVFHLIRQFELQENLHDFHFFHMRGQHVERGLSKKMHWHPLRCPTTHALVWSQFRLPLAFLNEKFDVIHVPSHRVPWAFRGKMINTMYDLVFLKHPQTLVPSHRNRLIIHSKLAALCSNHFITISQFTRDEVCEAYRIPSDKISVVHLGVDHQTYNPNIPKTVRPNPYILSVGTLQPRKNYSLLIRAFNLLMEKWKNPLDLLIVGQKGWLWEPIMEEARRSPHSSRIHFLDYVPHSDLPSLYRGALFFTMPSFYEGFGLPLLEAAACGTPVLASDIPSAREIMGENSLLLNPHSPEAWMEGMNKLLENQTFRENLSHQGLKRASQFRWEDTARKTIEVYEKIGEI